jgi:hypothetical protein
MGRLALTPLQRPQRFLSKQGNVAYASGNTNKQDISQTDYLTSLDLISVQTVTETTTAPSGTTSGAGAYATLANVQVKVNGGRAPFSLPGYHTNVYNQVWNPDYVDSLVTNPIVTNATNNWKNHLRIPLTVDPIAEKAAWYTGDTQLNLSCLITGNPAANIWQTAATATIGGGWDVYSEKFSAPAPDEPGGWLDEVSFYKQTELYTSTALSNGTTSITLETDQDYIRILLIFYTGTAVGNGVTFAPADGLYTSLSLVLNDKFNIVDTLTEDKMRFEMLQTYTRLVSAGTAVLDFMRLKPPTRRDILPTDPDSTKRLQLKIVSTSASNQVDVITETVVDSQFAEKWARSAAAKAGTKR